MDSDSLIIAVFCLDDAALPRVIRGRLRRRGPRPVLADSEVLTVEVVVEYLGLDRDVEVFAHFRRHYAHFFPGLREVHRTTFARQAANLRRVNSSPVAVCRFAHAPRSRRFRGEAGFGKDHNVKQTFYGFRLHARVAGPGVVTRLSVRCLMLPSAGGEHSSSPIYNCSNKLKILNHKS